MGKVETAVSWAENIAYDNSHGYDQIHRWGKDYDCSSLVISAFNKAGINTGATYTGNMKALFVAAGFKDVTSKVNLHTGRGLIRGDVLLVHNSKRQHTALYCGGGKEVEASINEKGTATGGKTGDQTGKEILVRDFRKSYYTTVLRYTEYEGLLEITNDELQSIALDVIAGKYGNGAARVINLEKAGYDYNQVQTRVNEILRG